jgi:hypothetical protein
MSSSRVLGCFDTNILVRLVLAKTPASQRMWNAFTDGNLGCWFPNPFLPKWIGYFTTVGLRRGII